MSRIGKRVIEIPPAVDVKITGRTIVVVGDKGVLSFTLPPFFDFKMVGERQISILVLPIPIRAKVSQKLVRELYGLSRTCIFNIIKGVSEGFQKRLQFVGVGYRVQIEDGYLVLNVGYSRSVKVLIPEDISLQCDNSTSVLISGIEKSRVGNFAAKIRLIRAPEPYKGKGISYDNEVVRRKPGKTGK
jgi:large subunit ribosomal protein L6